LVFLGFGERGRGHWGGVGTPTQKTTSREGMPASRGDNPMLERKGENVESEERERGWQKEGPGVLGRNEKRGSNFLSNFLLMALGLSLSLFFAIGPTGLLVIEAFRS